MREHDVACSSCGASVGQFCLIGPVRLNTIVHSGRAREAEFAVALAEARLEHA